MSAQPMYPGQGGGKATQGAAARPTTFCNACVCDRNSPSAQPGGVGRMRLPPRAHGLGRGDIGAFAVTSLVPLPILRLREALPIAPRRRRGLLAFLLIPLWRDLFALLRLPLVPLLLRRPLLLGLPPCCARGCILGASDVSCVLCLRGPRRNRRTSSNAPVFPLNNRPLKSSQYDVNPQVQTRQNSASGATRTTTETLADSSRTFAWPSETKTSTNKWPPENRSTPKRSKLARKRLASEIRQNSVQVSPPEASVQQIWATSELAGVAARNFHERATRPACVPADSKETGPR